MHYLSSLKRKQVENADENFLFSHFWVLLIAGPAVARGWADRKNKPCMPCRCSCYVPSHNIHIQWLAINTHKEHEQMYFPRIKDIKREEEGKSPKKGGGTGNWREASVISLRCRFLSLPSEPTKHSHSVSEGMLANPMKNTTREKEWKLNKGRRKQQSRRLV